MQLVRVVLMILGAACLVAGALAAEQAVTPVPVGSQVCRTCHVDSERHKTYAFHGECLACHTVLDEKHAVYGGKTVQFPDAEKCLSCHKRDRKLMNWAFGVHSKADGKCRDCHSVHAPAGTTRPGLSANKTDKNSKVCLKCHQEAASRFKMRSHHPVEEGAMACTDCHDPHGGGQTALKSTSEQCLSCHQAYRGPMVFEHAPVVEDCTGCHAPHGAPNRGMLSISQPSLCLQCHSIAQGKHGYGTGPEPAPTSGTRTISGSLLRSCTSCHGSIHGSQQDPLLRY